MENAVHAQRARQTKILILKSITTLNDATVTRILEKSDWNLRRAIEAFYMAKYKVCCIPIFLVFFKYIILIVFLISH